MSVSVPNRASCNRRLPTKFFAQPYVVNRDRGTIRRMPLVPRSRRDMLRRLEQLESELARVRHELKNLRSHDSRIAEVVMRGARLSRERLGLERRLELLRLEPTQANDPD